MPTVQAVTNVPAANRTRAARVPAARETDLRPKPAIREALLRVESEYREMPGLSLTLPQAARLWGFDRSTCELVLTHLLERRVLKRAVNGRYVRR